MMQCRRLTARRIIMYEDSKGDRTARDCNSGQKVDQSAEQLPLRGDAGWS